MTVSKSSAGGSVSSPEAPAPAPPPKKKRNLPGMPDPKAEVIALSPKSLLATNRFVCEICSKGFQRDQNLQLHRRGHNLPWKLRQRNGKEEVIKRVYVCPEPSCVHHNPSRALGDLTGIKKHFCRKHGEKKWKCEKCSKSYAVLSDWKAHSKTCGTREYRCGCGILFSRRDSFITHRAFCDALAEENARPETKTIVQGSARPLVDEEVVPPTIAASPVQLMLPAPLEQQEPKNATELLQYPPPQQPSPPASTSVNSHNSSGTSASGGSSNSSPAATSTCTSLFASLFASTGAAAANGASFSDLIGAMSQPDGGGGAASAASIIEPLSLCLSTDSAARLLPPDPPHLYSFPLTSPHMSATALLQKAAEMGAASPSSATALLQKAAQMGAASSTSFLRSLGLATSPVTGGSQLENISAGDGSLQWKKLEKHPLREQPDPLLSAGLGLGLAYDGSATAVAAALPELMMGSSPLFGPKTATLDFLGRSWSSAPAAAWDGRKPSSSLDVLELAAGKNKNNSNDPYGLFN